MLSTFPHFTLLTLDDKDTYEQLIAEYPPFSDISFATLHIWWNLEGNLALSSLNGNLVLDYNLPFDPENSGYCLLGKRLLDKSIEVIFDFLEKEQRPVKLVHVPEFVVAEIADKAQLQLTEEHNYNEYIIDSQNLLNLEGAPHRITRRKVRRFWQAMENRKVEVRELDLSLPLVQAELYQAVLDWEKTSTAKNDPQQTERSAIKKTLEHASKLGIRHVGVYIDDELRAILLYHETHDNQYYVIHHLKVDYSIPYIFDYLTHHIADKAVKEGIAFLNMEMDLGIAGLREHKMSLRPANFFKKYTITPARDGTIA